MDKEDIIGRMIHYSSIILPICLVTMALIMLINNPYGNIRIFGRGVIHAISAIGLGSAFFFIYNRIAYLHPLVRAIITLCFTVTSIHIYDFTWSLNKYFQLGFGFRLLPIIIVLFIGFLLERFDNKHGILDLSKSQIHKSFILLLIFVFAFALMRHNGFYERLNLYEQGTGPNPHIGSVGWILGKLTGFWILFPIIQRGNFKAPLRLDPRVLVW